VLKTIKILRERVEKWDGYPFSVPAIRAFDDLHLRSRVCRFAGENGTGKSTLFELLPRITDSDGRAGTGISGTAAPKAITQLTPWFAPSVCLSTSAPEQAFLRAESFFNNAWHIGQIGVTEFYGGRSLHSRSHGETFLTLVELKFQRSGLFLLDEPEAALSPQRQLSFLVLIHDVLRKYEDAQFIISTHSAIILGYPDAQILSFDDGQIHEVGYEETTSLQVVRQFVDDREGFLEELLREELPLFERTENS
jgi:predicted ATPase